MASDKVATPAEVLGLVMQEAQSRGIDWFAQHHGAGMTGSFMQETGDFRADVINFNVRGDQGTAYGLMQWRGERYENLIQYARQNNLDPTDIRTQVSFSFEEMDSNSPYADYGSVRALREFRGADNAQQTATAFVHAERPAGYDGNPNNAHDVGSRINHAARALGDFTGNEDLSRLGAAGQFADVPQRGTNGTVGGDIGRTQQLMSERIVNGLSGQETGFGLPTGIANNCERPASSRVPEDFSTTNAAFTVGSGGANDFGLPTNPIVQQTDFSFGAPQLPEQGQTPSFGINQGLTNNSTFDSVSFGSSNF